MEDLIKAVKILLYDIEAMRCIPDDSVDDNGYWFGEFSEYTPDCGTNGVAVEWPNLAIAADNVTRALGALYDEDDTGPFILSFI